MPKLFLSLLSLLFLTSSVPSQATAFREAGRATPNSIDNGSWDLELGDLDQDGDLDAVLASPSSQILINDGSGRFQDESAARLGTGVIGVDVEIADFDGDGDLDLFFTGQLTGIGTPDSLYLNQGGGTFLDVSATHLPGGTSFTDACASGDFDRDGDLDLVITERGRQDRLLLNNGAGQFADSPVPAFPNLQEDSQEVIPHDVDRDGYLDLLVINSGPERLFLNSGSGTFQDQSWRIPILATYQYIQGVSFGDFDGDSDEDLVLSTDGHCSLLENDGTGAYTEISQGRVPWTDGELDEADLADFDGDGDLDLLLGLGGPTLYAGYNQDLLWLNDGNADFTGPPGRLPAAEDMTISQAVADLDGDGDLDVLSLVMNMDHAGSTDLRVSLNLGRAHLRDCTFPSLPRSLARMEASAVGDLDGDDFLDLVVHNKLETSPRILFQDRHGGFHEGDPSVVPSIRKWTEGLELADLDADGDLDLYLSHRQLDALWFNDGSGRFLDVTSTHLPGVQSDAAAFGDFDGDGDLDLIASSRLLLNDGSGKLSNAAFPGINGTVEDIQLADFNRDGVLDIYLAHWSQSALLLNGGAAVFVDVTATHLPVQGATGALAGDVDNDGDIDLIGWGGAIFLHLNQGYGSFLDATAQIQLPPSTSVSQAELADFDQDGDLDLVVGKPLHPSNELILLENDGWGNFSPTATPAFPRIHSEVERFHAEDFDRDGDVDLFAGCRGPDRLFSNLALQLAHRGEPRIGQPLSFELHGPPLGSWRLGAAMAEVWQPRPPHGVLRLDTATLVLQRSGVLDASGQATVEIPVPPNPGLVGHRFSWQALIGGRQLLSNCVETVLSAY